MSIRPFGLIDNSVHLVFSSPTVHQMVFRPNGLKDIHFDLGKFKKSQMDYNLPIGPYSF